MGRAGDFQRLASLDSAAGGFRGVARPGGCELTRANDLRVGVGGNRHPRMVCRREELTNLEDGEVTSNLDRSEKQPSYGPAAHSKRRRKHQHSDVGTPVHKQGRGQSSV